MSARAKYILWILLWPVMIFIVPIPFLFLFWISFTDPWIFLISDTEFLAEWFFNPYSAWWKLKGKKRKKR